ncbi:MAG: cell division protein ZipA C-terminal FtsZ-binding domain-containing protein [Neisseria sp.]|nr:cell division protein ZipA C-terminal FtsZ-binding domain-containing protein [Neisseria sp.]
MNEQVWMVIAGCLTVIFGFVAYNMYQESKFRRKVSEQFGHSNKDALLGSRTESVRDGKVMKPLVIKTPNTARPEGEGADAAAGQPKREEPVLIIEEAEEDWNKSAPEGGLLMDLEDMAGTELPWFDPRIDYLAYISLREAKELDSLPRFSNLHRFRVCGFTTNNMWQPAEPLPDTLYQGLVIGLQAISRNGLASEEELAEFGRQAGGVAERMGGRVLLTDVAAFLENARPLDRLCERVDQIITIYLVSPDQPLSGASLQTVLEQEGFRLNEGRFSLYDEGLLLFAVEKADGGPFNAETMADEMYQGIRLLFDIPHTYAKNRDEFEKFMGAAVRLSEVLGLDLTDERGEELSVEWLKGAGSYIAARQEEMRKVGIEPGGELALRLFS